MFPLLLFAIMGWLALHEAHAAEILHNEETPGGGVIFIFGELKPGDEKTFNLIAQKYNRAAVLLRSPGGHLLTGLEIGRTIRMRNFGTGVAPKTMCASACALAWLGGTKRYMDDASRLGFHVAYTESGGIVRESGLANAVVGAYATQLGLPMSAVIYISSAGPSDMRWLTVADARRFGIDVDTVEIEKKPTAVTRPMTTPPAPATMATKRWLVVGSSADFNNAISIAASYKADFNGVTVLRSQNGHFAVALGHFPADEARHLLDDLKANQRVPQDAYLSTGTRLVSIDWQ